MFPSGTQSVFTMISMTNAFLLLTFYTYSTENLLRTLAASLFICSIIDEL